LLVIADPWIGWTPEQQWRQLHLVVNNQRFLILPGIEDRVGRALSHDNEPGSHNPGRISFLTVLVFSG